MKRALAIFAIVFFGCSGDAPHDQDLGPGFDGAAPPDAGFDLRPPPDLELPGPANNVAPMIVDVGPPPGTDSVNVPFVTITLCVPGTSTCQTVDHIAVDTGSSGLRVIASVLNSLVLPQKNATTGSPMAECYQFADGYTFGSVRLADVKIAGELAPNIPIQLVGDPAFNAVPGDCSSAGPSENTVVDFGSNGLIGINQAIADCGDYCADTVNIATGSYYSCGAAGCAGVAVANAEQVPNPVARFQRDNNGAILQFPSVVGDGAATLPGALIFGIGTAANNVLGGASVLTVDANGNFTTLYKGRTLTTSYIDSGTNTFGFNDNAIAQCGDQPGFYCPAATLSLTAQNQGVNGVSTNVSFSVGNTDTLFSSATFSVFDDLAGTGDDNNSFAWGFPFFIGRTIFVAFDGASTPGGSGPYFAY